METPVLQKIKNIYLEAARNSLGVQSNRLSHRLIFDATCSRCGMDPEDSHHAMVFCIATALRYALR
jgi:hypothetical protein